MREFKYAVTIIFLTVAIFVFAMFSITVPPSDLARYTGSAFGVQASIGANPYNILAQELKRQEDGLRARETTLDEREASLRAAVGRDVVRYRNSMISLLILSILLFSLIVFDFYFDAHKLKNPFSFHRA